MSAKVTGRDVAVIVDVYKYRYLSVSQIQALHFPSKCTAWRRLQALTAQGYLKAFIVPNISERVFYVDRAGAEVVAGEMQVGFDDLYWHSSMKAPKAYYFLRHFLGINDFRIQLTQACQESAIALLGFIPEYIGEKTEKGIIKKYLRDQVCDITNSNVTLSHTPDGVFSLEKNGNAALFFLEIDRGTENMKEFSNCIAFYLNYWTGGQFKKYADDFGVSEFKTFRTLIITTGQKRLQNMREVTTRYPFPRKQAKRFLWGATDVSKETIFSPVWQSMDVEDDRLYTIG